VPVASSCCGENIRYEKYWTVIVVMKVSKTSRLHHDFSHFMSSREIKSWWTKTSTVECTVCSLRSTTQHNSFCRNTVTCAMPDLCIMQIYIISFSLMFYIFKIYSHIFMFIIFLCCCHNCWRMWKTLKFAKSRCRIASTMVFRRFRCVVPNLQP